MRMFKKVAIVGTGLIGGSLGLALKKRKLAGEIVGVARHRKSLLIAMKEGVIDRGSISTSIIRNADLVILATPVKTILSLAPLVSRVIKPDCIVTDVGSTKKEVVASLEKIFPLYLGSHPLAGSEKRGVCSSRADLFENSPCILTPTKKTKAAVLRKINALWKQLGSRVVYLSPDEHDRILSFVSHLPHLAAFSLMKAVPGKYLRFAGSGLKDATRIAASDSQVWKDVFLSNRRNLLRAIGSLQNELSGIKNCIREKDERALLRVLKEAKAKRDSI